VNYSARTDALFRDGLNSGAKKKERYWQEQPWKERYRAKVKSEADKRQSKAKGWWVELEKR